MNDTISRQAAIDYFVINVGFHDEDGYPIEDTDELKKIWTEYFDGIPSVQKEIVCCKDCKHYEYGICKKAGLCVNKSPNGFCDWGDRRTE